VWIENLSVQRLRNVNATVEAHCGINWLYGENGAGKTSVLEAIYVLARGRSFRASNLRAVIGDGSDEFLVTCATRSPETRLAVQRGRECWVGRIDRQSSNRVSEFARRLPLVLIDPETHQLVEGAPSRRRTFLDWALFHVEPSYLEVWKRYHRLLKQRNAALRGQAADSVLDAIESPMADSAIRLDELRQAYVTRLQQALAVIGEEVAFRLSPLGLVYRPEPAPKASLVALWREQRNRDREVAHTRSGPHRGDLVIRIGERLAAPRLSRGQMKLAALQLKLAELRLLAPVAPMLLLDDPVSELDAEHLGELLGWIEQQPFQSWITAVRPPNLGSAARFHVEQGKIRRMV